jgi:hypothetical protein
VSSLQQIRDAIKTTVGNAIAALTPYDTIPGAPVLPALAVMPAPSETADFVVSMGRGTDTWRFDLVVLVSARDEDLAQDDLDGFISGAGAFSIRQAIWNARTLGLADCNAHVSGVTGYNLAYTVCSIDHVAATLRLVVHTSGTA